jgi:hypothetical protein
VRAYLRSASVWSEGEENGGSKVTGTVITTRSPPSSALVPSAPGLTPPLSRALHLCLAVPVASLLATVLPLCPPDALPPDALSRCVDLVRSSDPAQACLLLAANGQFAAAAALLTPESLTAAAVDACTPAKGAMPEHERKEVLLSVARACERGRQWVWACKRYTLAGDRARAVRCLCRDGDVGRVWYYSKASRQREVALLAARWMQRAYHGHVQAAAGRARGGYAAEEAGGGGVGADGCVEVGGERRDVRELVLELLKAGGEGAGAAEWCREAADHAARLRDYVGVLRWSREEVAEAERAGVEAGEARGRVANAEAMAELLARARRGEAGVVEAGKALASRCGVHGARKEDVLGVVVEYCARTGRTEEGREAVRELLGMGGEVDVWGVVSEDAVVRLGMEEEGERHAEEAVEEEVGW